MKAIILGAGQGKRLLPLTENRPKALLSIAGRSLVAWQIRALAAQVRGFVVPEINYGQMVLEVERCASGQASVRRVSHGGGGVHDPEIITQAILEIAK